MKFAFSDDQQAFAETFGEVLERKCPPDLVRECWDSEHGYSQELWQTLTELGVVAMTVPEECGGLAMNECDSVLLMEQAGRYAAPVPLLEHTAVGVPALGEAAVSSHQSGSGQLAQISDWLEQAATGKLLITAGIPVAPSYVPATSFEPVAPPDGSAPSASSAPATFSASFAHTIYANFATQADVAVLCHGNELYAVSRSDYEVTQQPSVDGTRRIARVEWTPSQDSLLSGVSPDRVFDRGALAAAAQCVGVAAHLLEVTVEYVKEREQFGKPVGTYQAVKHHLADVAKSNTFARPSVYAAAWAVANNVSDQQKYVSAAKSLASDAADLAAKACLQCHGAIGYTFEYDLQMWLKRAWVMSGAWGSASWHRQRLSHLLGV